MELSIGAAKKIYELQRDALRRRYEPVAETMEVPPPPPPSQAPPPPEAPPEGPEEPQEGNQDDFPPEVDDL